MAEITVPMMREKLTAAVVCDALDVGPGVTLLLGANGAGKSTLLKLLDVLDDDDDVQTVWGNYEISDEVMEKLG